MQLLARTSDRNAKITAKAEVRPLARRTLDLLSSLRVSVVAGISRLRYRRTQARSSRSCQVSALAFCRCLQGTSSRDF